MLVPVDQGLLMIRRGIEPQKGKIALPGGFINVGETWQEAGAREVLEETLVSIDAKEIREYGVRSAGDGTLLIFGVTRLRKSSTLPPFRPTPETSERLVIEALKEEPAFELHVEMIRKFLGL
jgi:ADP-ribose pyrophosphatase YjhB (NUDIX family)